MCRSRWQYLLLEVADGVLVSISEEIQDVVFDVILLQVVHQVGTIALQSKRPEKRRCKKKRNEGEVASTWRKMNCAAVSTNT